MTYIENPKTKGSGIKGYWSCKDIEKLRDILLKLMSLRSTSKKLMCNNTYGSKKGGRTNV